MSTKQLSGRAHLRVFDGAASDRGAHAPAGAPAPSCEDGFFEEEWEGVDSFRWMSSRGRLGFDAATGERFLEVWLSSEFADLTQSVTFRSGDQCETLELPHGWARASVRIPPGADGVLLEASKPLPAAHHPEDSRALAVRVRVPQLHADPRRHESVRRQWENAVLNTREMLQGATTMQATPLSLGIDLHGSCNVKPACVYCEWDESKRQEGDNVDVPFTVGTLQEYGEFFENATKLVNCSIGEPFMMRNLDELLDVFGARGKTLEMSTNGQILTERNIQKLLGRDIDLYISLDAATPETYARLRNDTFERIRQNISRLVGAKGGRGRLPRVFLVFMPMKANAHELDGFVRMCAELNVDKLILRPLNATPGNDLDWERGGYHFRYEDEFLPLAELARMSGRAAALCRELGVDLSDQMDFGGALETLLGDDYAHGQSSARTSGEADAPGGPPASELAQGRAAPPEAADTPPRKPVSLGFDEWPICTEPWRNLYILRRGIRPCCYGGSSIGGFGDYREAWNSPILQDIRAHLRRGAFHQYCVLSPACPIVRKSEHAQLLPTRQRGLLWLWRAWQRLNSVTGGMPRRLLRRARSARARLSGSLPAAHSR